MDMQHGEQGDGRKMWMMHREHMAIRVLTAVIVIIFVFWCGFEFGEIRASIGPMSGFGMMHTEVRNMGTQGWAVPGTTVTTGAVTAPPMMNGQQ